jgi:hypothetical protein
MSKFIKYSSFFFLAKKEKKNCKDLGVGQDLTEFAKLPMLESLRYIYFFKKKIQVF